MRSARQLMNCLVVSGLAISDNACNDLFFSCCAMAKGRKDHFDIKTDELEGRIETEWAQSGIGGMWGYVFSATLDTDQGRTFIRYIIRFADLERIQDMDLERISAPPWMPWQKQEPTKSSQQVH